MPFAQRPARYASPRQLRELGRISVGKIVTIEYVDDIEGTPIDAESVDTVAFSYRGQDYTLVLTKKNGVQFDKDVSRYVAAAKKAQSRDARATRKPAKSAPREAKPKSAPPAKAVYEKARRGSHHGPRADSRDPPMGKRQRAHHFHPWTDIGSNPPGLRRGTLSRLATPVRCVEKTRLGGIPTPTMTTPKSIGTVAVGMVVVQWTRLVLCLNSLPAPCKADNRMIFASYGPS